MANNPYDFGQLQAQVIASLFPFGLPTNLVASTPAGNNPIRDIFVEALLTCQKFVECLQVNNTQIVPQCNTLFQCGYTVTDAPRGRITRIYVVDKVNQQTGLEDATVPTDWCSIVEYRQVGYDDLDRYVSQTLAGALDGGFWPWIGGLGIPNLVAFPFTGIGWSSWYEKFCYPPPNPNPTTAPPLPMNYTYPQSATDDPAGRSQWGLWALKGGQIFIAPWIQSTETIVIEWNGLKRSYLDTDLIDDDPMLIQAVEAYVAKEYARKWDKDYDAEAANTARFNEALAILMDECRKENEKRAMGEGTAARGAALVVPTFVNTAQTATAQCPAGSTGNAVTYTVPAGTVVSLLSVADANAMAASQALQIAGAQLSCAVAVPTWTNTPQPYTANCGAGSTGNAVTVNIPAGQYTSTVSQLDANAQALAAATSQAQAQLVCVFGNTVVTATGTCNDGSNSTTITIAAGLYTGPTQLAANTAAQTAANNQLATALATVCGQNLYTNNSPQSSPASNFCSPVTGANRGKAYTILTSWTIPNGVASSAVSQAAANTAAQQLAIQYAEQLSQAICTLLNNGSNPALIGISIPGIESGWPGTGTWQITIQ